MTCARDGLSLDGVPLVRLESDHLRVDIAPSVGGRIVSLVETAGGHEFLWRNCALPLKALPAGSEYDPNFFGGIDELVPNDMLETLDGVDCPDHGELWTTRLDWQCDGDRLKLRGQLPAFGLEYERQMSLRSNKPCLDFAYRISNPTSQPRHFLWKLHAALAVEAGDLIECPARKGRVVDLAWSRYRTLAPFDWPMIEGQRANVIPPADGTVDFFYLLDLTEGRMTWRRPGKGLSFTYEFDPRVFPYAWMFASYGGFNGHYTVILEPCTAMPIAVNEAAAKGQCSVLQPGETLETRVSIWAGRAGERDKDPAS
jgi:galactose mutarotase-like enzyme